MFNRFKERFVLMKYFIAYLVIFLTCLYANINQKFAQPSNCAGCHAEQYKDWKGTWHSNAHEDKNELYKKVVSFVQKKVHQSRATVLTHCAKCHNPKLEISKVSDNYMYAKAFEIETEVTKKVDKALKAKHTKTGIACFICHNIDKLDDKKTPKNGGLDIVHWTKGDLIVGPFKKNTRAGFHQIEQREHFVSGNKLCLTCHQGSGNYNNLDGYQTGEEIQTQQNAPRCVECHMSSKKKGVIAPNIVRKDDLPIVRNIRSHRFAGARNSDVLSTTLSLAVDVKPDKIDFLIKNLTPHKVPTGFSGRSIEVEFLFYKQDRLIGKQKVDLRAKYLDKRGEETLVYVANKLANDTRLAPNELRLIALQRPKEATKVEVNVWYYLLAPSLQELIDMKTDKIFSKKYKITSIAKQL